ncbi:hypothetical protein BD414DRAFT_426656 [Trametes punicea]|nr:hypothetical protein BD414DRAFT_426656 [Trametes punicea]
MTSKPGWLTDELAHVEEWVDWQDDERSVDSAHSGSDLSLTQPLGSVLARNAEICSTPNASESDDSAGTFIVREDVPQAPLLPKTPGRSKKPVVKDFFSPLALEKMFEPPSPPQPSTSLPPPSLRASAAPPIPSRLAQVHLPSTDVSLDEGQEAKPSHCDGRSQESDKENDGLRIEGANAQFTFSVPRTSPFNPAGPIPNAESTPGPSAAARHLNPPSTDPRLRLFQFQYDTFTRDHLSAMVDSIAVNTPSGEGATGDPGSRRSTPGLSPVPETSFSRLRSAKRIKLSPASDFSGEDGDGAAVIMRPLSRKDYVGESRNLMEQIRKARDFSTVSTVATARSPAEDREESPENPEKEQEPPLPRPSFLAVPDNGSSRGPSPPGTMSSGKQSAYSSLGYRQQGLSLMAQIRNDMKGSKRLFSTDTEASHVRNNDNSETSLVSADATVPSLRSRGGDLALQTRPRQLSTSQAQIRRTSAITNRLSSIARGKQPEKVPSSPQSSSHSPRIAVDEAKDLTEDFTRMSLESSKVLAQFPVPPVRVVSASALTVAPSPVKPNPGLLAPPSGTAPAYPSSSLRDGRNADLTRFVSSSTASGTTVTAESAASFVKHQGPKQIMRITPNDVPALPDRVGKMVFDRVMMRWVKATAIATAGMADVEPNVAVEQDGSNDSEDPFRDIESIREDDSGSQDAAAGDDGQHGQEESYLETETEDSRVEENLDESEVEDAEEAELTSFSTDGPSHDCMPAIYMEEEEEPVDDLSGYTDDPERGDDTEDMVPTATIDLPLDRPTRERDDHITEPAFDDTPPQLLAPPVARRSVPHSAMTPHPSLRFANGPMPTPAPRSAIKSSSITPVSALKDPSRSQLHTPANKVVHRRSVSFSDGKHDGPIVGIGRNVPTPDGSTTDDEDSPLASGSKAGEKSSTVLVPSARSKRIANMLDDLENDDYMGDSSSKPGKSSRQPTTELQPMQPRRPNAGPGTVDAPSASASRRVSLRLPVTPRGASGNATFLTECSFGVAHDKLVQVITDVQPFEPYWEELTSIDLSHRNLDSMARLKEFLPKLDSLSLNSNQLAWLSGIPGSVRTLSVASNLLTGVTSFSQLLNLENLDISRNQIDSLRQLQCLRHLRELRADGNRIDSVDGLQKMDGLIKLSLQGNELRDIYLQGYKWTRLEMLNLSQNRISCMRGLGSMPSLVALNLDDNALGELEPEEVMPRLRILRVSGNRLQTLDAAPFPNLRTLYADNNSLGTITKAYRLTKLENLSLRNQSGRGGLTLSIRDVRDVKRLYLSGNPLKPGFLSEPCYNLLYLELAACRLIRLPREFARMVPNVRVLNLNYNFLEDPTPLRGLTRLRKLTIIGSRIKGAKHLVGVLRGMHDMEMIDFRQVMNPCTLGWYLPLLVKDLPGALQPSDGERNSATPALLPLTSTVGPEQGLRRSSLPATEQDPHQQPPTSDPSPHTQSSSVPSGSSSSSAGSSAPAEPKLGLDRPRERTRQDLLWREIDAKFRRDLPDDAYVGRLAYRGLVVRACPNIRMLDGVEVERKERDKAERLLRSIFGAPPASFTPGSGSEANAPSAEPAKATEAGAGAVEKS